MTNFTRSPKLTKGGIVVINPDSGGILKVIALQYNPAQVTRSFEAQVLSTNDPAQALRFTGPPVETITLNAEIDAADQLENPEKHPAIVANGIAPLLATLELLLYPTSAQLIASDSLASMGMLEIAPLQAPLTIFVWGENRVQPVRITQFSVTEDAHDPSLNPLRANVNLTLRVLNVKDLGFMHRGGNLYMAHQRTLERLAGLNANNTLTDLGLKGLP